MRSLPPPRRTPPPRFQARAWRRTAPLLGTLLGPLLALSLGRPAAAALIQLESDPLAGGTLRGGALTPLERAEGGDTPVLTFRSGRGPVRLLLDTGASSTMVTPALARRLGLGSTPLPPEALALAGGGQNCSLPEARRTTLPPLALADLRLRGVEALLLPIGALPAGVDGVLGIPSLRQLPVWVDPGRGLLALGPQALAAATAAGPPRLRLPLRWRHGVPLIDLRSDQGAIPALADTGAEGLFLSPALAARLAPLGPARPLKLVGVCGEQTVQRQPFAGLALPGDPAAPARSPLEGIVTGNPIFAQLGVEAILGQELLRHRAQLWRLDADPPQLLLW